MDCKSSSLCFFDKPGVLSDITRRTTVAYYPNSTITANAPIEYKIPGSTEDYVDTEGIQLYVQVKVTKADGKAVDQAADFIAFCNLVIASLFQDACLVLDNTQVEGGDMNYPYKAYFKTVTQFTPAAQKSHMLTSGWIKDEAGKFDDKTNEAHVARMKVVGNSALIEFMGPLFFDFFNQPRPVISQMPMRIKLLPSKPEFALNAYPAAATDYRINIEKSILYVDRLEMNPSVINGHAKGLKTQNALYPITHTDLISFTIPAGQFSYIKDNLFPDLAPKMLMVAMVENEAVNGNYKKNPYHFQHFDLNKLALYRDGVPCFGEPFTPKFGADKLYMRSYNQTMRALDYYNTDDTNGFTPDEWANGYVIYVFDLTGDKDASSSCIQANLSRNLRLDLSFEKPLSKTINVMLYAVSDSMIEITQLRDVITHYNR